MLSKAFAVAACVAVAGFSFAHARTISGPASLPPPGFTGEQFVDANGCVFLKASYGGKVTWVPRVDQKHHQLCGYPPTFGPQVQAAAAHDMAPGAPAMEMAEAPAAPAKPAAPAPQPQIVVPTPAPHASAQPAVQTQVAAARPVAPAYQPAASNGLSAGVASNAVPKPPKGYKLAWKDDRLNPLRGQGTASGQAMQDQLWTRDVPAVLVAERPRQAAAPTQRGVQTSVSTMSAPTQPVASALYVQVGTFGEPGNAAGASARLAAIGLPVASGKLTKGGRALQIVYAGPFGSQAEAQMALIAARGAGFADAFIR